MQVKAGTEVLWAILTPGHSVEVVGIDGSDSGPLEARMIHTYRFDTPGTYRFRCSIHSTATEDELAGTVIVIP